ncbi:MAG: M16 family metallopeptidase [Phycisphaerae bacterium]
MRRSPLVAIAALCLATALLPLAFAQPLPTDPSLITGELENGMRYIVRKHPKPEGRATLWMHVHTGSLNETDAQRGIAHYLEHMAFNGSANFPPGAVVPFFQSLGMTFGRDQNAFTSFEQTTYQLSLPDVQTETIGKGMTFFADVLFRLSLPPKEIESERGIIQEERRRSLSGRQRTSFYVLERIAPGSLFGFRLPIGTEQTIATVQEKDFQDYYTKWYAASNCTLMVVADADPATIVEAIKKEFSSAPKKPRPTPENRTVKAYEKSFAIVTSDPEVRSEEIQIVRIEPARKPIMTVEDLRSDFVATLGEMALNRRLDDKVAAGGTNYQNISVNTGNQSNTIYMAGLTAQAKPGKWKEALEESALELQRARKFGFTSKEIDDARTEMLTGAQRAVETESTAPAQAIIGRINRDVTTGEPITSREQELDLLSKLLPTITPEEVSKRFAAEFETKTVAFVAILPDGPTVPTEAQLLEIGTKALTVEPTQDKQAEHAKVLMTEQPKPGAIVEQSEHAAAGVWSGWLSNGVRVHYRFMDDRKSDVSVRIALIGGELLETAANHGITQAAQIAWGRPATDKLTSTDIKELMTGKKISVGGGGGPRGGGRRGGGRGDDSLGLSVSGSPEDLEFGMQLAHLLLTKPRIEAPAFEQFQERMRQMLAESEKNPMMAGARIAQGVPFPESDPRTQPLTIAELDKLTLDASQAWLDRLVANSPIEVTIVGDLPKERAIELVQKYVGSLPTRQRVDATSFADLRKLQRPAGPRAIEKSIDTPTPQAFVMSGFYGPDETATLDVLAMSLASRVLSTRMVKQVREDAQLVYSISAGLRPGSTYPGFGVLAAGAPTEPTKTTALVEKLASMYAEFATSGPTDEELTVAKKQFATSREEDLREPGFWMGRIDRMTYRGMNIDEVLKEGETVEALTAAQIRETFAKYFSDKAMMSVVVKPSATAPTDAKTPEAKP